MKDFLFEIGTEEIPAGYIQPALAALENKFAAKVKDLRLDYTDIKTAGTPRRFVLSVTGLAERQEDVKEELLGPSKSAGFDADGNPTKAAEGFARSKGAAVEDLAVVDTPKGEYLLLTREVKGKTTVELLAEYLPELIMEIPFPKSMKWAHHKKSFARPIQWMLCLFGEEKISFSHNGMESSNYTMGHRFLHNEKVEIATSSYTEFEAVLDNCHVIIDYEKRKELVIKEIKAAVVSEGSLEGGEVAIDEGLLATVTNLVEKPYGVCGVFDNKFLQLPPEVLITSMREHQKYFPVVDRENNLMPAFVAVNNTEVKDVDVTRKGHQRVLRARLEDAFFFFESDKEVTLKDRCENLGGIIFQAKLGTMAEKCERITKLTHMLCEVTCTDPEKCETVARLCKADLLTDMVGEFASLQGVMGGAYALQEGYGEAVALGIKQHYMPLRAGAPLPESAEARIVGLADRLDTLVGNFGVGQSPSGTVDPFGLRRVSIAILHLIEDSGYTLSLKDIIQKALALYGDKVDGSAETVSRIIEFIKGRFVNDLVSQGVDPQAIDAAASVAFDNVNDVIARIESFVEIKEQEAFSVLAASYKRIKNIIKSNELIEVQEQLFEQDEEKQLYTVLRAIISGVEKELAEKEYLKALTLLLDLKQPVDDFFDKVMVMHDDEAIRQNRLNLLTSIGMLVLKIGDISKMQEG